MKQWGFIDTPGGLGKRIKIHFLYHNIILTLTLQPPAVELHAYITNTLLRRFSRSLVQFIFRT